MPDPVLQIGHHILLVPLALALAASPPNDALARAEGLVQGYKYEQALAALASAKSAKGNDLPTLLRILELEGIVAGQLRRGRVAEEAFWELLVLDPGHQLPDDFAPRVTTPFFAAKRRVVEKGSLSFVPSAPSVSSGLVREIGARVDADPLQLAHSIRFHLAEDGGGSTTVEVPLKDGRASAATSAASISWWAELLGERGAVLALVGGPSSPRTDSAPPLAPAPLPALEPVRPPEPQPQDVPPGPILEAKPVAAGGGPAVGWGPLATWAGGGAALGAGLAFGALSQSDANQVNSAPRNALGQITGLTEQHALQLQASSRQDARIANAAFIGAGVLVVAGALWWWLGTPAREPGGGSSR